MGTENRLGGLISNSDEMIKIFEVIKRISQFQTTVLITGESGTGKELIARAIHDESDRANKPFVAVNCGSIPEALIESEFFGHKKGAFTDAVRDKPGLFKEADRGTIFLDEIGELPLSLQTKLLRVLQDREFRAVGDEQLQTVDVRVIAATLKDLEKEVKLGSFRDDLFYRLNVVNIAVPALRKRLRDIPILVNHFIEKHSSKLGIKTPFLPTDLLEHLLAYSWPGNVRELENCIERLVVLADSGKLDKSMLPDVILREQVVDEEELLDTEKNLDDNLSIKKRTIKLERNLIIRALKRTKGNRTHAAKLLEISHRALLYKIKEYGLEDV